MDPKAAAIEAITRILAACVWATDGLESKRGAAPRLHLGEATEALEALDEWVRRGGFRPDAREVMEGVQAYFNSQATVVRT